jgi:predicted nuclease of predicted toxin-antitoxin system
MSDVRSEPGTSAHDLPPLKLLYDENLSPALVRAMASVFPDSSHVRDQGLEHSDDEHLWERAKTEHFIIVSKDADFHHLSFARGAPPKVIWLDVGNCSTSRIEEVLRDNAAKIIAFHRDASASFLIIT